MKFHGTWPIKMDEVASYLLKWPWESMQVLFCSWQGGKFKVCPPPFWLKIKLVTIWHFILSFAGQLQWKLHLLHIPRHCEPHSSPLDRIRWLRKYLQYPIYLDAPWLPAEVFPWNEANLNISDLDRTLIGIMPLYHPWILVLSKMLAHAGLVLFGRPISIYI